MRLPLIPLLLASLLAPPSATAAGFAAVAEAVSAEDWDLARSLAAPEGPVAAALVDWSRLRDGAGSFSEYQDFLAAHPDWPGLDRLRAEGERAMPPGLPPETVLAFFGAEAPQTGEGAVRLADALIRSGRQGDAETMLVAAWLGLSLDGNGEAALRGAYGALLDPMAAARVDAMLWRWRVSDAERLMPLLSADDRLLAEARIALIRDRSDAAQRLAAVPAALRDNPGLQYDRFNRFATRGDYTEAIEILAARTGDAGRLGQPMRWASWRATLARWLMRDGRPDEAYALASQHHLTEGEFHADLEWLSGYLALRQLNDPVRAAEHFAQMEAGVSGPISVSRAAYWQGRAYEAARDPILAVLAYDRAAQHQTAFYGLLAAEKLGLSLDPALTGRDEVPDWRGAPLMASERGQALSMLLDVENRGDAFLFVLRLAQDLPAAEVAQLGRMLTDRREAWLTVAAGKAAVERGVLVPAAYFPLHPLAEMPLPVAPELALSIARRESEFNFTVGSPVGALGLMQLMPGTAEEVAGDLGLPYSRARLTSDWAYNATLGSRYLADLEQMFGASPVMIAAGYNAGPGRPRSWMAERGDPRAGEIDVVDWIEMIPFTETRNYVMRVTESIPVYRARLTGETGPVRFTDLLIGAPPFVRPVSRPQPVAVDTATSGPVTPPLRSAAPLRPTARPDGS